MKKSWHFSFFNIREHTTLLNFSISFTFRIITFVVMLLNFLWLGLHLEFNVGLLIFFFFTNITFLLFTYFLFSFSFFRWCMCEKFSGPFLSTLSVELWKKYLLRFIISFFLWLLFDVVDKLILVWLSGNRCVTVICCNKLLLVSECNVQICRCNYHSCLFYLSFHFF